MTILNKDGNVYVVKGPNPLTKKQQNWEKNQLTFHNFEWEDINFNYKNKEKISKPTKKKEEKKEIVEEEPFVEPIKETPKPIKQEEDEKDFELPYIKYKVLSHCLPTIVENKKDSFYGESWKKIKYGKKIIFPLVVIESTDLTFDFWTSDPNEKINVKSIIYPFAYEVHDSQSGSYNKVPYDEYRWWKIISKEEKEGGWFFRSVPSEVQPDFSD